MTSPIIPYLKILYPHMGPPPRLGPRSPPSKSGASGPNTAASVASAEGRPCIQKQIQLQLTGMLLVVHLPGRTFGSCGIFCNVVWPLQSMRPAS